MAKMKLKTLSGAKKRFKMTASGQIKRNATKRRHILTKKTTQLTRGLWVRPGPVGTGMRRTDFAQNTALLDGCGRAAAGTAC